ncbi:unnamed protein product [Orchesella dallaii]|uniref:Uncharacterized protein n=1 Tax=Orchesella dallaii TaxID=48710 RepID=A0ABP1RHI5_9HEXA
MSVFCLLPLCYCDADVVLYNHNWHVTIDPATLALRIQVASHPSIVISEGTSPQKVLPVLQIPGQKAKWQWEQGEWQLQAELQGCDLLLTIHAKQPGRLLILQQPAAANGQGLILPLSEGHYIPQTHSLWEDYLLQLQNGEELNTIQDLSLPLWGMDHGHYSLHWIFTNPFNNKFTFQRDASSGISLAFSHEFTILEPTQPFTAILHLANNNRLAGAQRYRQWLLAQKRFEPLAHKIYQQPEGKKLLGATHLYLWGNGPLSVEDVRDWPALIKGLRADISFSREIWQRLDRDIHDAKYLWSAEKPQVQPEQKHLFIRVFNQALTDLARSHWQKPTIDLEQLGSCYKRLHAGLEQLQAANLTNLWLGIADGWEGGLWHPAAVTRAVQAGYLIAPYDSYETALPPDLHRDWSTAHLGEEVFSQCGIIQADGQVKSGFQQQGVYTNPSCVRPFLQQRIRRIQNTSGYNSLFIDCYAAGMLFDDYRQEFLMSQARMAQENINSMRWVGDQLKLVVGSENGNAVTARGLHFAHGMQTSPFGWKDFDLQNNSESIYYLGNWYPTEEPTLFFKKVPLREPYKTVLFDVRYRLPLYQAVFHDSVITTHHWLLDNLKLNNVQRERTLTQLLYNVPPLFHINRATLKQRLPDIQRQDAFFKPLHQWLATQALIEFRWLNQEGSLQQTQFTDGSWLIANFGSVQQHHEGEELPAYSVTAKLSSGAISRYIVE